MSLNDDNMSLNGDKISSNDDKMSSDDDNMCRNVDKMCSSKKFFFGLNSQKVTQLKKYLLKMIFRVLAMQELCNAQFF